ncbi:hypothetical protein [Arcobacter sp. LA11]|uniref:hypothetical protein n=1 Tax=Arcobacter sp. LA11 TaxID=1898176 RepID=UPI000933E418|nr:hypothetical protein [Arcobacter sp. LA11]
MENTLSKNILIAWENTKNNLETKISSEKTLVFRFSMELSKLYNCRDIFIDFEYQAYTEIETKDKYLDLLVYELANKEKKYAIEFKAPTKSIKGNSNQTETREKIYKDIARLKYLKSHKNFTACIFFMITDEKPYVNKSENRDNTYDTSMGHIGNLNKFTEKYAIENFQFTFNWEEKNLYYWLNPITI